MCKLAIYGMLSASMMTISACDNSNGSSDVNTGYFTDSAVAGMTYTTATQSGTTDAAGTFMYKDGETITFSVGGIVIGEAVAATSTMTPFDLVPGAMLYTNRSQVEKMYYSNTSSPARQAFTKITNILVFLQTLDDDADPDNGINVPAGVAALLNGVMIDFDKDIYSFSGRNSALQAVTSQAAGTTLLSTNTIRQPGEALDHFYAAQGITHQFAFSVLQNVDKDGDGNPDTIYTYDAEGNLLTYSDDSDMDGNPNFIQTSTYDADGNHLTQIDDSDGDGNPNRITTYTYDANGNKLASSEDNNADGNQNYIQVYAPRNTNWTALLYYLED